MNNDYLSNVDFAIELHDGTTSLISRHFHPYYEFYYLCKGEVDYLVDGKIYSVRKGDLVVIPPNTLHKSIKNNAARKRILLYLNPSYLDSKFSDSYSYPSSGLFHLYRNNRIPDIFFSLLSEFNEEKNQLMIRSLLYEFIILLSRHKDSEKDIQKTISTNSPVQKVMEYIHSEYTSNISLSSAATALFMNKSYLSRTFKKHTGFTFTEYLNNHRIQTAIKLLEDSSKNISEIAEQVGFNSLNHFCKTFKNHIGCSPLNYRKQLFR